MWLIGSSVLVVWREFDRPRLSARVMASSSQNSGQAPIVSELTELTFDSAETDVKASLSVIRIHCTEVSFSSPAKLASCSFRLMKRPPSIF